MTSQFIPPSAGDLRLCYVVIDSYDAPSPFLSGNQHFRASGDVERQLPELGINTVYDHSGKPGSIRMIMEMADPKVLLNHIADF